MINLDDFTHIPQESLTTEDYNGISNALREAQQSSHTTQVGASLKGLGAWNKEVSIITSQYGDDVVREVARHHAESLAILHCARAGVRTQDATMYAPWASCLHCAMDIQAAGIVRVVVLKTLMDKTPDRWLTSVEQGLSLLWDHGVRVDVVDVREGYFGYDIRMDGKAVKV